MWKVRMKGFPEEPFMEQNADTVFDRIISGEIPVEPVYENDDVLAFNDLNPQAPVHVLVIPKKRLSRFSEFSAGTIDEAGRFFTAVSAVASALNLDDLHAHILGGRKMNWPPG